MKQLLLTVIVFSLGVGFFSLDVFAAPITVLNHSFELVGGGPIGVKSMGVEPDDWSFGNGMPTGSGIEAPSSDGAVCVAIYNIDSVYQLTGHTITEGDAYTLKYDSYFLWAGTGDPWDCTSQGRLYYDNGGSRTVIDQVEYNTTVGYAWYYDHTLTTTIPSGHAAIGNQLGIELAVINNAGAANSWYGFDNVRLDSTISTKATNPVPTSGSSEVAPGVVLSWSAPTGLASPTYNVYMGGSPGSLVLVSSAQSGLSYDPPGDLAGDSLHYWKVDTIDGPDVYPGDLWYFQTQRTLPASSFYLDSLTGNDSNTGLSPGDAWASLVHVNTMTFIGGDKILFKAGTSYSGQFKPQGSGADGNPLIIDMYGSGNKPAINGGGVLDAVLLENVEYCEISNLKITNLGATRMNWRTGIKLWANDYGTVNHVYLRNLDVYDVNGSLDKNTEGCGIYIESSGPTPSRFDDVLVEDCHVLRTDRNGICMRSSFTGRFGNWFPSLNVMIRKNLVEDCGGDAIKPWGADGCIVEHNRVDRARQRCSDYAAGIWPWSCDNTVIQFNEVSGMKGTLDGQGFDSDYNCKNSLFQYNYSHDNDGGFILIVGPYVDPGSWDAGCVGTVVRYNVSQNDGLNSARIFHISGGGVNNTTIYNNIIYVGPTQNLPLLLFGNWSGWTNDTKFYNNIFYVDGTVTYSFGSSTNNVFENNVFYGGHVSPPFDASGLTTDPQLVSPGSGGVGLGSVGGYQLQAGSPCIATGRTVAANGNFDYFRNRLDPASLPDRGVHAYTNTFPGDLDANHVVNGGDLGLFMPEWMGVFFNADLNGDGSVDAADFGILAKDWQDSF